MQHNTTQKDKIYYTLSSEKTPTHIFIHIYEWFVDLNKKCNEYT